MKNIPLNNPIDRVAIDSMVQLFDSIFEGNEVTYVSTPLTSGNRFLTWFRERGSVLDPESKQFKDEHFRFVVQPNSEVVKKKVFQLRKRLRSFLINPIKFNRPEWNQDDYRYFWGSFIEQHVDRVVFIDDWQFSKGSAFEFLTAYRSSIETLDENLKVLDRAAACQLVESAIEEYKRSSLPASFLERIVDELKLPALNKNNDKNEVKNDFFENINSESNRYFKDSMLDILAVIGNVAQFVSFEPIIDLTQRYSRIANFKPNYNFSSPKKAIEILLKSAVDGTVNIRSFHTKSTKGEPLKYGLYDIEEIMEILRLKASEGKITIVNETIDINDGGVSGVAIGPVIEFSPNDTPQCVDKPGVCRLPRNIGINILETVYSFRPTLDFPPAFRVEFSIHPKRHGLYQGHTLLWELEKVYPPLTTSDINWPNNFSKMLGDKAYGLLLADAIGLPVPYTTVFSRSIAPFSFGRKTRSPEIWMRTCPTVRLPGKYPTYFGWRDPFKLMANIDPPSKNCNKPGNGAISSILAQRAVKAEFSGSLLTTHSSGSKPYIEGVRGLGDSFMIGQNAPLKKLPVEVSSAVSSLYKSAFEILGPVEIEWVYDGEKAWVIQLHKGEIACVGDVIFPGEPKGFVDFKTEKGLESLRKLIPDLKDRNEGVVLVGDIGLTSHFGDLLRKAKIPSKLKRPKT